MKIQHRIKGFASVATDRIRPCPQNWRLHPERQREVLRGILASVGVVDAVLLRVLDPGALAALREVPRGDAAAFGAWLAAYDGDYMLVDGHLRVEELQAHEGAIDALILDVDQREAAEVLAVFDPIGDLAEMDRAVFEDLTKDIESASPAVNELMRDLAAAEAAFQAEAEQAAEEAEGAADAAGDTEEDEPTDETPAPDPTEALREKWGTAQGQLWEVVSADGQRVHRILCGDCRKPEDVARLLGGHKINVAFTSPPYASQRKYDEESGFRPIPPDEYVAWFEPVQANVRAHLAADGSWFVNIKEGSVDGARLLYVKELAVAHVRAWGWTFIDELCWLRQSLPGDPRQMRKFKNGFEPIFHFARTVDFRFQPDSVMHETEGAFNYADQKAAGRDISHRSQGKGNNAQSPVGQHAGMAYPSNILDIMEGARVAHEAAFPMRLPSFFVRAYSDPGDVIFDPFLGSGTTLLAADQHGRIGYGTELSPKYVAVALERCASKGLTPRLAADRSEAA